MPSRKPQIAVVATRGLADLCRSQLTEYAHLADWRLLDRPLEDAEQDARSLWRAGLLDALVAAGANAQQLREALPVPVATIQVNGFDVLLALQQAQAMDAGRVVILTRQQLASEFADLQPMLSLPLDIRTYQQDEAARQLLRTLAHSGERVVVVGSSLIVSWAMQEGLPGVILYSAPSVRRAFDDALEVARIAHLEEIKRERLDCIVQTLAEGVVAVDMEERIETLNPAMAHLLGVAEEWATGRRLSELCPPLSLQDVLRSGEASRERVESVGQRTLVTHRLPLIEQGQQTGAVLTFQDASSIQSADRKLRTLSQRRQFRARYRLDDLVGESPAIQRVRELARLYGASDAVVLLQGESGTGKELLAQGMHLHSARRHAPFVAINCAAFPDSLLESELFGFEEGAFTGSRKGGKAGLIELAHTGTLFLDEIGDMPLPLQTRLLRVLQEREVLRLGGVEPTPVDLRVMAATHADLRQRVAEGRFRADLYYRLNILALNVPPLRERLQDLPLLAQHLLAGLQAKLGQGGDTHPVWQAVLQHAQGYAWPGNVRELENLLERALVFHLGHAHTATGADWSSILPELHPTPTSTDPIEATLAHHQGDLQAAARALGISRTTLWRRRKGGGV
ncbi:propionate catabolism operon regulatory protein PrpR [Leeia aquatica]|uniref:Propionate catabolism operon regulatory protein PrpR n=1 Tax=Leeia aquatica TaxID=2725557 RepID=A0A847SEP7_9NEIS|nr:propionate catabolism operon regulatory protein PrpR [Leeia aquatica]NLR75678.1 propionate catabolism operon regulatory protein PrpR [Leeia aquatica]